MYVPTRKHCSGCRRWRVTCTDFHVAEWRDGRAYRLQSRCVSCQRGRARVRNGRSRRGVAYNTYRPARTAAARAGLKRWRKRRVENAFLKGDPVVPIGPLRQWLNQVIMENGFPGVVAQLGCDPEFLRRTWRGVERTKTGRWERKRNVHLALADLWLSKFGQNVQDIYPYDEHEGKSDMATQAQFEARLAESLEWSRKDVVELLDLMGDLVYEDLKAGEKVVIRHLGTFQVKATPARPAREGRNPATGETMMFAKKPAGKKMAIRPYKPMKDRLRVK